MIFKGKTAVITGGARGIGKAASYRFAELGANVVLNYRTDVPSGLIEEIESMGVRCLAIKADVSLFGEAKALILAAKEHFGSVDYLVNNAGITKDNLLLRMTENDFDSVINTNLKGAFNTIHAATPVMLKQKSGAIVNLSSVVGIHGNAGQVNYAASKAALVGLTKSVAKELGGRGITCNAIAPGFIETDMTDSIPDEIKQKMLDSIPLKRFGRAGEVADLICFLCGNGFITGEVIQIDGGMMM